MILPLSVDFQWRNFVDGRVNGTASAWRVRRRRRRNDDGMGLWRDFTKSYEELRKLDAIDAIAPSRSLATCQRVRNDDDCQRVAARRRRRRRRSRSFSRICATRYALSRPTETTIESFMRSIVVVNVVVVVVVSEEWWRKRRNGQRNASWNTGKTLFWNVNFFRNDYDYDLLVQWTPHLATTAIRDLLL